MADRWFVRCDAGGVVIRGFTDDFEQPQAGDIEITGQQSGWWGRHFRIQLFDSEHRPLYKIVNGVLVARTTEEMDDAAFLALKKEQAIRYLKKRCKNEIEASVDTIELIEACAVAIEKLYTDLGKPLPKKYASMKSYIASFIATRNTKIAAVQACTSVDEIKTILNQQ